MAGVYPGRSEFRRVADEPWFDPGGWVDLGMELQAENVGTRGKGLVAAHRGRGEMDGAPRQIEGVAVPMQHRRSRQMPQRCGCGGIRQIDRPPADLLDTGRIDSCAERAGDELGAKADTESRPAGAQPGFEKIEFLAEKWIFVVFISADGRAEHDDEIWCHGIGEIAAANIAITELIAGPRQRLLEGTEILEMNVPYDGRGFHRHCVSFKPSWPSVYPHFLGA